MALLSIDTQACAKDGFCADVCPGYLISFQEGEVPTPVSYIDLACIRCGHCVSVCPQNCLSHADIPQDQCVDIKPKLEISEKSTIQFLKSRRSVRRYKERSVPREEIEKILDITRFAPTGHNTQGVSWAVFDNKTAIKTLSDAVMDWCRLFLKTEPEQAKQMGMAMIIDTYEKGVDIVLRNAPVLIIAHGSKNNPVAAASSTIALTTLELAAKGCGLGTCWAGFLMMAVGAGFKPLVQALNLPENQRCFGAMMLGYPKLKFKRIPVRNQAHIIWND